MKKNNITTDINVTNDKYIYVIHEDGAWGMHKHFKQLGAVRDELGWWMNYSVENINMVAQFCNQAGLAHFLRNDLPAKNLEAYERQNRLEYHQEQAEKAKKDFDCIKSTFGLESVDISIPLADLETKTEDKKILELCNEYHKRQKLIKRIQKEELIAKIPADEILMTGILPSALHEEHQEELLSYLYKQTFDDVIKDGFSPENFEPHIFIGHYRPIMEGIVKAWEQGLPVSNAQLSIDVGDSSSEFYAKLKSIENRTLITAGQVASRLESLNQHHAKSQLATLLVKARNGDSSLNEKLDVLRKGIDVIHGGSNTMLPQSHYLHRIVEDLQNPKPPLLSGIKSLDQLIGGGFVKKELGMLSGGAGSGKTAFALQVADSVAQKGGVVVYVSIEIGISKLTERSLKRLRYSHKGQKTFVEGVAEYEKLAGNIYLKKGHHGMLVSEIRGMVLSIMRQREGKDVLVIIDPFQRLGSGDEKIDFTNETIKTGILCSQLKEMTESLNIPILALSDTVKSHQADRSGEVSFRGSYMINHTADYTMTLKTSLNPMKAIYGIDANGCEPEDDPFFHKVKDKLSRDQRFAFGGMYELTSDWDKYASLSTSKVRDGGKFHPLFIYRPAHHLFEDIQFWDDILPVDSINDKITGR